jgi:hypothetical protein
VRVVERRKAGLVLGRQLGERGEHEASRPEARVGQRQLRGPEAQGPEDEQIAIELARSVGAPALPSALALDGEQDGEDVFR